jgi:uncharacterized surface protein with fasciclin (FAS1) repeats
MRRRERGAGSGADEEECIRSDDLCEPMGEVQEITPTTENSMNLLRHTCRALAAAAFVAGATTALTLAPSDLLAQQGDIVETAVAAGSFNTLATALEAAGLVETLQGEGPFTVFAPTDEAFAALPEGTVESLLRPENREALIGILTYHVVPGRVTASQVVELDEATTVNGADVSIRTRNGGVQVNESNVVTTDVFATNGVIHVIDQVLLPPETMEDRAQGRSRAPGESRGDRGMDVRGTRAAAEILVLAIDRGVPLFNEGSPEATAAIYEVAARSVLAGDFGLPADVERALESGLREGGHTHDARARAWAYRDGLDRALDRIESRMAARAERH